MTHEGGMRYRVLVDRQESAALCVVPEHLLARDYLSPRSDNRTVSDDSLAT